MLGMCWSVTQVKACRIRDIKAKFIDKHLPWCALISPLESSECNCHNLNRDKYLQNYAESIIINQDCTAKILGEL
jgi:hypothetical protein